jgi:hypothetical protein
MKKPLLLLPLCLLVQFAFCQVKHPKIKQDVITVCNQFMDTFQKSKFAAAFDLLKPYTVIEDYKLDTLANKAALQVKGLSSTNGKMLSYELVQEKTVKSTLSRLYYLLKFEQSYLKFRFTLYNNGEDWTITGIKYAEDVDDLF